MPSTKTALSVAPLPLGREVRKRMALRTDAQNTRLRAVQALNEAHRHAEIALSLVVRADSESTRIECKLALAALKLAISHVRKLEHLQRKLNP